MDRQSISGIANDNAIGIHNFKQTNFDGDPLSCQPRMTVTQYFVYFDGDIHAHSV